MNRREFVAGVGAGLAAMLLGSFKFMPVAAAQEQNGVCIYCGHCQPCPADIDIGAVNRYMDLANHGDELAKDHYLKLARHASDCLGCGSCERRCQSHVKVRERMKQASELFGI